MFQALAALLIGSVAPAATVADFRHDVRGDQTCVVDAKPERCLKTLDLGQGIDILAQVNSYAKFFDDAGKTRDEHELTEAEFLNSAAGLGLTPAHRNALTERFAYLKINRIAANIEETAKTTQDDQPVELPFLAEVEWAPKADQSRHVVTFVEGRLASDGKEIDLTNMNPTQLNTLYTNLVHVDRVSSAELDENVLRDAIAPAVLGNEQAQVVLEFYKGLVQAVGEVAGKVAEAIGQALEAAGATKAPPKP